MKPKVLVYRSVLLPYSETFIIKQVQSLKRWDGCLAGEASARAGIDLSGVPALFLTAKYWSLIFRFVRAWQVITGMRPCAKRKLHSLSPELVHVHFATDAVDFWPVVKDLNVPVLITLHGYDIQIKKNWWHSGRGGLTRKKYPEKLISLSKESRVSFVAVSAAIKRRAIEFGLPEDKIYVCNIGVDVEQFQAPQDLVGERKNVLFVGRLVEKKGCKYLIDAFSRIQQKFPESELRVIGGGPDEAFLKRYADQYSVRVNFLGTMPYNEVKKEIAKARVFCLPSIRADNGDAEGFGLVILEAQSSGVPVITSAEGGREEGIRHGVSGFSHGEKDVDALTSYLEALLSDDRLVENFSSAAVSHVRNSFSIDDCSLKLESLYDELVSS